MPNDYWDANAHIFANPNTTVGAMRFLLNPSADVGAINPKLQDAIADYESRGYSLGDWGLWDSKSAHLTKRERHFWTGDKWIDVYIYVGGAGQLVVREYPNGTNSTQRIAECERINKETKMPSWR